MTELAVVAYPRLSDEDRLWIEAVRARHDPQAARIKAHFTLLFPAELAVEPVAAEVASAVADFAPIPFVLARATAVSDAVGGANHVFLVPDEGREQLRALHDRLHAGSLRSLLRPELVFVPHVTVAACGSDEECERVATKLNETRRTIRGSVPGLDLIEVAPSTVRTLSSFPLGLGATRRPSGGSGR